MYFYTRSLTTLSCIYTVVAPIRRHLLIGWNDASQTSATGCLPTALSSTRTRLSCYGSDRDTVFPTKTVVLQFYNLVLTQYSVVARDYVRLFGVTLLSDLCLD